MYFRSTGLGGVQPNPSNNMANAKPTAMAFVRGSVNCRVLSQNEVINEPRLADIRGDEGDVAIFHVVDRFERFGVDDLGVVEAGGGRSTPPTRHGAFVPRA